MRDSTSPTRDLGGLLGGVCALGAMALLASCLLSGYDKSEGGAGGGGATAVSSSASTTSVGGSGGATVGGGGGDAPLCDTTRDPAGPVDATPGGDFDVWLGLRSIQLGKATDPTTVPGFDLDRAYSCRDDCSFIDPECVPPDYLADLTPEQAERRCDWPKGVDNTGVYMFDRLSSAGGIDETQLSEQAEAGEWGLIVRVSDWNGEPDDAQVTVSLYSTLGFEPAPSGTTGAGGGGGGAPTPIWNGTDRWSIDARSLTDPANLDTPTFRHNLAYVSDGKLVAQVDGLFYAGSTRLPIRIGSGSLVATLTSSGPSTQLTDATFAGRWAMDDLIAAMGPLLVSGIPFCNVPANFFYTTMADFCRLVDVTSPAGSGTCNAISLAIRFDAAQVQPGTIVTPTEPADPCPPTDCAQLLAPP